MEGRSILSRWVVALPTAAISTKSRIQLLVALRSSATSRQVYTVVVVNFAPDAASMIGPGGGIIVQGRSFAIWSVGGLWVFCPIAKLRPAKLG